MADKKEKDLTALAQSSSVTSDSFIRMVDKDGKSVKIARDIFLQAIRDALPSVLSSLGGTATQFLAKKSSGGIGYETLANAAALLGVRTAIFGNGSPLLPENADLNDYTTPGAWRCPNSTTAGTISNRPNKSAFQLWYISPFNTQADRANYGVQIAFGHLFGIMYRQHSSEGIWGNWTSV